jgi:4'-phosphopantetheinyl transferase
MPELGEDKSAQVHIWFTQLDVVEPVDLQRYKAWFTPEEDAQFARFLSERRCREFIVGRGLARLALAELLHCPPECLEFCAASQGKLSIAVPQSLRGVSFNISHTADCVACGVCEKYPIGLDVERVVDRIEPLSIAQRFYSESESRDLNQAAQAERLDRFFQIWTLKEALAKAHGSGFLTPIDASQIKIFDDGSFEVDTDNAQFDADAWLAACSPSPQHRMAVCMLCSNSTPVRIVTHACPPDPVDALAGLAWSEARLQRSRIRT